MEPNIINTIQWLCGGTSLSSHKLLLLFWLLLLSSLLLLFGINKTRLSSRCFDRPSKQLNGSASNKASGNNCSSKAAIDFY